MPADANEFQKSLKEWSRWKHAILIEYLKAMAAILRSWGQIYYVDGFAGPGIYTDDGASGSPVLAARHARELTLSDADYSLKCINVELNANVFQNLENSTAEFKEGVVNYQGDFGHYVPEILEIIGNKPTLFFLDPIGLRGLEWNALLPIFRREATTEILLRFDAQTATRLTGTELGLHPTFNSIIGERNSEYWMRYVQDFTIRPSDKKSRLTKAYEDKLSQHFDFVARIPIRSSGNQIEYYLLYATRKFTGAKAMNDALFKITGLRARTLEEEERARNTVGQMNMFAAGSLDFVGTDLRDLKKCVLKILSDGSKIYRGELRAKVAMEGDNFGRFAGWQFTAVLGGRRDKRVPKGFESLRDQIQIHNGLTVGNDKVEISLKG